MTVDRATAAGDRQVSIASAADGEGRSRVADALRTFAICVALPFSLGYFVFYGFLPAYTGGVWSRAGFLAQYGTGIYRYRVLGRQLMLGVHSLLQRVHPLGPGDGAWLKLLDPNPDLNLYHAAFVLNTAFMCLTAWLLLRTLALPCFGLNRRAQGVWTAWLVAFATMTEFVVVPYDTLSYSLLVCGAWLLLRDPGARGSWVPLAITVVLAALTRETAALTLSFAATLHVLRYGPRWNRSAVRVVVITAAFVATYVGLRIALGWEHAAAQASTLTDNLQPKLAISLALLAAALAVPCADGRAWRRVGLFLLASAPYVAAIFLTGLVAREVRLWVPLVFSATLLALVRPEALRLVDDPADPRIPAA